MVGEPLGTFARAWAVRPQGYAWFLGAGSSAAAGAPTAVQIRDDLLLRHYADANGLVRDQLNLADPATAERLRVAYDNANGMPPWGSADDYSRAFELVLNSPAARRDYLRERLSGITPSYGQRVLGALMSTGRVDLAITTNFDDLIERSAAAAYNAAGDASSRLLTTAAIASSERAQVSLAGDQLPLLIKLHGDFAERHLKNLDSELQQQDETLRQAVIDLSRRYALVVVGYSGRDQSIMNMLRQAAQTPGAWPGGIWWLTRDPETLPPTVTTLLDAAAAAGVEVHPIQAANFDETMSAVVDQVTLDPATRSWLDGLRERPRVTSAAIPTQDRGQFPVLRYNALPVLGAPSTALSVPAEPGLTARALRERLQAQSWRGAAVLGGGTVVGWGDGSILQAALNSATPAATIRVDVLAASPSSQLHGVALEALTRALARGLPARPVIRSHGTQIILTPDNPRGPYDAKVISALRHAYEEPLAGRLPTSMGRNHQGEPRQYAEACRLYLERRLDVTWLLFEPFTWVEARPSPDDEAPTTAPGARNRPRIADTEGRLRPRRAPGPPDPSASWRRERWAQRRRNDRWAKIIDAWATSLAPGTDTTTIHVLPRAVHQAPGAVGGIFELGTITAYSREAR